MPYTIVRNLRGSWPEWFLNTDDGRVVYVRLRHGYGWIGVGATEEEAGDVEDPVESRSLFAGVTDVVDALTFLRENGFYYVCPT